MTLRPHHSRFIIPMVISFLLAFSAISYAELATYTYDELNQLKRVQYDDGSVIEYTYDGAGNRLQIVSPDLTPPTTTASPAGGLYNASKSVTLTCNDGSGSSSGCDKIYFTTDGITPTISSAIYSSPISITATTILRFFATDRNGNSETVKSQTYTIDKTLPTGTIRINSGASYVNSVNVTLNLTCSDANGCSQMKFSNDAVTYSSPEAYSATRVWTLTAGDGAKNVYVRFMDGAGNWSTGYSASVWYDTVPPTGTITINSGAAATNSATVTLTLRCTDTFTCSSKALSNDDVTFSTSRLVTIPTEYYSWTLTPGDGAKTVYVKYMDVAGNWSQVYSKTILLETVKPTTTASPAAGTYSPPQSVTLACSDGTGSGCNKIYYTTNGSTPTTSSAVYSSSLNITATTTLKFFATDIAGNSETVKTQVYTMDTTAPTGSISINSGAAWANTVDVTLTLSCSDANGCSQMKFSDDNVTYSATEAYASTKARSLTSGDGSKTVYVKFKDTPGNWSTAYSDAIQLDATAPATTALPAEGTYSSTQSVSLTCDDSSGSGCSNIYYTTDGSTPTTSSSVYSAPLNISATTTLKYFARDVAGNSETVKTQVYTIQGQ